ncbi:MAG: heavy-metal-associated domain-containing protein [Coriobacteriia bacterium]|nr:heavy-metal-associated domain-containing protein [Coriobacteriia bacterium]MDO9107756.1 heavy-metal-associated domain-containing protein [Coriobacteriia bacterium]
MNTITLKTSGMHCPSCSMLIEMNVSDLPGVESVKASHAEGSTVVTYDQNQVDASRIESEIRAAGYEAETVS